MKLNIQAPINQLSYGIMATNMIKELDLLGVDITLFPIGKIDVPTEIIESGKIIQLINNQKYNFRDNDSLRIYHQHDLAQKIGKGRHFGYTTFELDEFTAVERNNMNVCDKVITATRWGQNILQYCNTYPDAYAPLGVDRSIFNESVVVQPRNIVRDSKDKFVVLNIGKAEKRKGTLEAIRAFNLAFTRYDPVELWLVISNVFLTPAEKLQWRNKILDPLFNPLYNKTRILDARLDTQHDIAQIIQQADCGLFLHHSEGFGLPILEMMSCGKDVIVTNYSGSTEFANEKSAHLVDIDTMEIANDDKWFTRGVGGWASIGVNQITTTAAHLINLYDKVTPSKSEQAIATAQRFTWQNTAKTLVELLLV